MSRADRISEYIHRQFISEDGDVVSNIDALFDENVAYHVGDETLDRHDMIEAASAVRSTLQSRRRIDLSGFREDGDVVSWSVSATLPGMGDDGSDIEQRGDLRALFGPGGKIVEVWSVDSATA